MLFLLYVFCDFLISYCCLIFGFYVFWILFGCFFCLVCLFWLEFWVLFFWMVFVLGGVLWFVLWFVVFLIDGYFFSGVVGFWDFWCVMVFVWLLVGVCFCGLD